LQEKSGGKVPVINDGDFWLPDSDEIVKFLEEKYPEPSMASDVPSEVTGGFFGAFRNLLLAKPEEAEEKRNDLVQEMNKVRAWQDICIVK
jgi:glutathione S-transferase